MQLDFLKRIFTLYFYYYIFNIKSNSYNIEAHNSKIKNKKKKLKNIVNNIVTRVVSIQRNSHVLLYKANIEENDKTISNFLKIKNIKTSFANYKKKILIKEKEQDNICGKKNSLNHNTSKNDNLSLESIEINKIFELQQFNQEETIIFIDFLIDAYQLDFFSINSLEIHPEVSIILHNVNKGVFYLLINLLTLKYEKLETFFVDFFIWNDFFTDLVSKFLRSDEYKFELESKIIRIMNFLYPLFSFYFNKYVKNVENNVKFCNKISQSDINLLKLIKKYRSIYNIEYYKLFNSFEDWENFFQVENIVSSYKNIEELANKSYCCDCIINTIKKNLKSTRFNIRNAIGLKSEVSIVNLFRKFTRKYEKLKNDMKKVGDDNYLIKEHERMYFATVDKYIETIKKNTKIYQCPRRILLYKIVIMFLQQAHLFFFCYCNLR